jgi:hypothetical protein
VITLEGDNGVASNGGCLCVGEPSSADKVASSSSSSEEMYLGVKPAVPWNEADLRTGFCTLETKKGKFNALCITIASVCNFCRELPNMICYKCETKQVLRDVAFILKS